MSRKPKLTLTVSAAAKEKLEAKVQRLGLRSISELVERFASAEGDSDLEAVCLGESSGS